MKSNGFWNHPEFSYPVNKCTGEAYSVPEGMRRKAAITDILGGDEAVEDLYKNFEEFIGDGSGSLVREAAMVAILLDDDYAHSRSLIVYEILYLKLLIAFLKTQYPFF